MVIRMQPIASFSVVTVSQTSLMLRSVYTSPSNDGSRCSYSSDILSSVQWYLYHFYLCCRIIWLELSSSNRLIIIYYYTMTVSVCRYNMCGVFFFVSVWYTKQTFGNRDWQTNDDSGPQQIPEPSQCRSITFICYFLSVVVIDGVQI